jgi:hypothetical protein
MYYHACIRLKDEHIVEILESMASLMHKER